MSQENSGSIVPIFIEDEMRGAYIDYSMSVIVSRALPDVRDGLKPVHRRVLYGMHEMNLYSNRPYMKSARIVGEVLGKYHPHGDSSVYDTMVRMAQTWSLRYTLVDGQGNFGSLDGDSPAAMRYTEARLKKIAEEMLSDLDKETVDMQPNYDDKLEEPTVLPSKLPNLLINGSSGIAVGMATNMPPHNLSEVVDGIMAYIDNREIAIAELMKHITAPDFPTGGQIYGYEGVRSAYQTGRGRVVIRAEATIEEHNNRSTIIFTSIPYQITKEVLVKKVAELVNEKKIEGISDLRDESDKNVRIVIEVKRDAEPQVVLMNLYKYTQFQHSFSINNIALVKGRPMTLNLKDLIHYWVEHRHEIVVKRTQYDLNKAREKAHILEGLLKALDHIDEIIELIKSSPDTKTASERLISRFEFSERQATAILEMQLRRLTGLEREKIEAEFAELMKNIEYFESLLASEELRMQVIKDELAEIKKAYGDSRHSQIIYDAEEIGIEDMIADEQVVITISHQGYIKRTLLTEYRLQHRGGVGLKAATTKDDDFTEHLFVATTHNFLLIFTDKGKMYWLKVYQIPEGSRISKGRPLQNLIQIEKDEKVRAIINVKNLSDQTYINSHFLVMCSSKGTIKKTVLEAFSRPRGAGIIALNIEEGDSLLDVQLTDGTADVILATKRGYAVRFQEDKFRSMGRTATGVKGISLADENDRVVGMACVQDRNSHLLVISEKGFGKRSEIEDYRLTNRGGKGILTMRLTDRTGGLISIMNVNDNQELMIVTRAGIAIRMEMSSMRVMGRATQGVKLIRLNEEDDIASIAKIEKLENGNSHSHEMNSDEAALPTQEPQD
jgi:DNA gyrase subunit A